MTNLLKFAATFLNRKQESLNTREIDLEVDYYPTLEGEFVKGVRQSIRNPKTHQKWQGPQYVTVPITTDKYFDPEGLIEDIKDNRPIQGWE